MEIVHEYSHKPSICAINQTFLYAIYNETNNIVAHCMDFFMLRNRHILMEEDLEYKISFVLRNPTDPTNTSNWNPRSWILELNLIKLMLSKNVTQR